MIGRIVVLSLSFITLLLGVFGNLNPSWRMTFAIQVMFVWLSGASAMLVILIPRIPRKRKNKHNPTIVGNCGLIAYQRNLILFHITHYCNLKDPHDPSNIHECACGHRWRAKELPKIPPNPWEACPKCTIIDRIPEADCVCKEFCGSGYCKYPELKRHEHKSD